MLCKRFVVFGRVQGVGFRAATRRKACELGVVGWVGNRQDGGVELVAEGTADAVDAMEAWLQHGPVGARVARVEVAVGARLGSADKRCFRIRRWGYRWFGG